MHLGSSTPPLFEEKNPNILAQLKQMCVTFREISLIQSFPSLCSHLQNYIKWLCRLFSYCYLEGMNTSLFMASFCYLLFCSCHSFTFLLFD